MRQICEVVSSQITHPKQIMDLAGPMALKHKLEPEDEARTCKIIKQEIHAEPTGCNSNPSSRLIFEADADGNAIIEMNPSLASKLKPHQLDANRFMWRKVCRSLEDLQQRGSGCIIAHCMGLGKTLSTIAFIHTLLSNPRKTGMQTCVVVAPVNVNFNWISEFGRWQPAKCPSVNDEENSTFGRAPVNVFNLNDAKGIKERIACLRNWHRKGGVMVLGYEIYRRLGEISKPGDDEAETANSQIYEILFKPGPDIVVFDEGHVMKSENSALSRMLSEIATKRRIILTGTPMQNNLMEYHCMVSHVRPGFLGSATKFKAEFVNPIRLGETKDASEYQVHFMKRKVSVLHRKLSAIVHRCGFEQLRNALPPKQEYVILLRSTPVQTMLYENYLKMVEGDGCDSAELRKRLFADYHALRNVCNHPYLLFGAGDRGEAKRSKMMAAWEDQNESDYDDDNFLVPQISAFKPEWFTSVIDESCFDKTEVSSKMTVMMEFLRSFEKLGEKALVFTQSVKLLDLIENILAADERLREIYPNDLQFKTFQRNRDYFRIDGSVPAWQRNDFIEAFNDPDNKRGRLFLISTKAGGIGINLVAASRAIIMDQSWNPANDCQAIFRCYRFGQTRPVFIYRLVQAGTMEETIYDRQVLKQALSHRVIDAKQITRHFTSTEIEQLYQFDGAENGMCPENVTDLSMVSLPTDRTFADLLYRHRHIIKSYHDHDSLLIHQHHEEISEAERQLAWQKYAQGAARQESVFDDEPIVISEEVAPPDITDEQEPHYNANSTSKPDFDHSDVPNQVKTEHLTEIIEISDDDSNDGYVNPTEIQQKQFETEVLETPLQQLTNKAADLATPQFKLDPIPTDWKYFSKNSNFSGVIVSRHAKLTLEMRRSGMLPAEAAYKACLRLREQFATTSRADVHAYCFSKLPALKKAALEEGQMKL